MKPTVMLKQENIVGSTITYFITKSNKTECNELDSIKDKKDKDYKLREILGESNAILLGTGDAMKTSSQLINKFITHFTSRKGIRSNEDRATTHYRCYEITEEEQLDKMALVNLCPDSKMSWQSALRKLGFSGASGLNTPAYYEAYCILWKTVDKDE